MLRQAELVDVPNLLSIRYRATENKLEGDLSHDDIAVYLRTLGQGWVAEHEGAIVGFAIANKKNRSVWALFVLPSYQGYGIGRALLEEAKLWLQVHARYWGVFRVHKIWLDTQAGARSERFYQRMGWHRGNLTATGEVRYWYEFKRKI